MNNFSINIAHLYGDLMNTYGDYGNIIAIDYYAKKLNVTTNTTVVSLNDKFDADKYDFVVFGGGQDYEESIVAEDIVSKKEDLKAYIDNNGPMIAICGGYQLLGKYMVMANGTVVNGIGILPHYTVNMYDKQVTVNNGVRITGNVQIENETLQQTYVGFENHQGRTFLGEGEKPLGKVLNGLGNNGIDGGEGAIYKNVFCSYFHGPIIARNGNLALHILELILTRKYPNIDWQSQIKDLQAESY